MLRRHALSVTLVAFSDVRKSAVELVERPRCGDVQITTVDSLLELRLEESKSWIGDRRTTFHGPSSLVRIESWHSAWTDETRRVSGERVYLLRRRFDELELQIDARGDAYDGRGYVRDVAEGRAGLTGCAVLFEWDGEHESYSALADDGTYVDRDWRADLRLNGSLAELLPSRRIGPGDAWLGDSGMVRAILRPGGRFEFRERFGGSLASALDSSLVEELEGDVHCTLVGIEGSTASIELVAELQVRATSQSELEIPVSMAGLAKGSGVQDRTLELHVEGTLAWDLELGRLRSAELRCDVELRKSSVVRWSDTTDFGYDEAWSGTWRSTTVHESQPRLLGTR
jgi:hypothetical protein